MSEWKGPSLCPETKKALTGQFKIEARLAPPKMKGRKGKKASRAVCPLAKRWMFRDMFFPFCMWPCTTSPSLLSWRTLLFNRFIPSWMRFAPRSIEGSILNPLYLFLIIQIHKFGDRVIWKHVKHPWSPTNRLKPLACKMNLEQSVRS